MVLHAKVCGRLGDRRHKHSKKPALRSGLFTFMVSCGLLMPAGNPLIRQRLSDLIEEGEQLVRDFDAHSAGVAPDQIRLAAWMTSCLNLLDKLSISSNRFVGEFEFYIRPQPSRGRDYVLEAALGVMKSASVEYSLGLAVEYHLSVSAAVFGGLLDEADYLAQKGYIRAAAVLAGAALEEGLRTRARASGVPLGSRDTLNPLIVKLKAPDVGVLSEYEAKRLESVARMRNDAAHSGDFDYSSDEVAQAIKEVSRMLEQLLLRG